MKPINESFRAVIYEFKSVENAIKLANMKFDNILLFYGAQKPGDEQIKFVEINKDDARQVTIALAKMYDISCYIYSTKSNTLSLFSLEPVKL